MRRSDLFVDSNFVVMEVFSPFSSKEMLSLIFQNDFESPKRCAWNDALEVAVDSNIAFSFSHCLSTGKKKTLLAVLIPRELLNEQLHSTQWPWVVQVRFQFAFRRVRWQTQLFRARCHGNWPHAPNLHFFGAPWSEWSRIRNPDPDSPKGTHPCLQGWKIYTKGHRPKI